MLRHYLLIFPVVLFVALIMVGSFHQTTYAQPISYSKGVTAAEKWDYEKAEQIFTEISKRPGRRNDAKNWLIRIERIREHTIKHKVRTNQTWEEISLQYFRDISFASRLATFNGSSIITAPEPGSEIEVPIIHIEAHNAMTAYDNPDKASLSDLAMGIALTRKVLTLDPDYPDFVSRLEWADEVYSRRTVEIRVDSLDGAADALLEDKEYTEAIQTLEIAQQLKPDKKRVKKIRHLVKLRKEYIPTLFELGNERFRADDLVGALKAWRRVSAVDPHFRDVQNRIRSTENMLRSLESVTDTTSSK